MRLPKTIYRVATVKEGSWRSPGGGTFWILAHAQARVRRIREVGGDAKLFMAKPEWVEIPVDDSAPRYA